MLWIHLKYDKLDKMRKTTVIGRGILLFLLSLWGVFPGVFAQNVAVKTNFLYLTTLTPNVGAEFSFAKKNTVQLFYGLNPWEFSNGKSLRHWVLQPEYRYWFCESFNGWFVGCHLMGGEFNMGNVDLPLNILEGLKDYRYEGWYAGGGVSVGYQWMLSRHWNFEASIGLGYDYIKYDKFECGVCGEKIKSSHSHYFGPTRAALSLLYIF